LTINKASTIPSKMPFLKTIVYLFAPIRTATTHPKHEWPRQN
jgi:hypothetical protein